jgi:hypothetical protein
MPSATRSTLLDPITPENAVLLLVDQQEGLFTRIYEPECSTVRDPQQRATTRAHPHLHPSLAPTEPPSVTICFFLFEQYWGDAPTERWGRFPVGVHSPAVSKVCQSHRLSCQHSKLPERKEYLWGHKEHQARQCVLVGIKDVTQPPDGTEIRKQKCATTQWSTFTLPLISTFPNVDRAHLHVLFEVVFAGPSSVTIELSNIRYSRT